MASSTRPDFEPEHLERSTISVPLKRAIRELKEQRAAKSHDVVQHGDGTLPVIVELNLEYPGGRNLARDRVLDLITRVLALSDSPRTLLDVVPTRFRHASPYYVFADLLWSEIEELMRLDAGLPRVQGDQRAPVEGVGKPVRRAIHRIWPSHPVRPQLVHSVRTIKGDAARATFGAAGKGIVWAVIDSGIDGEHPHFAKHANLRDLPAGTSHKDFTGAADPQPLIDRFRHGTHVAGIIAGENERGGRASIVFRDDRDRRTERVIDTGPISGVAPECKLVSYKVLGDAGQGDVRNVMAALEDVCRVNADGREIRIHGVNLSLGYPFDPEWFACGQSPVCEVVNRLVRSGVVVVAAAGNTGYAYFDVAGAAVGQRTQGAGLSINDPGNADQAITVGSTHPQAPHRYGVSYFSSKGPTGDGRLKPDLLAPGERILSCSARPAGAAAAPEVEYREESGTSMAAPHVSGAVAAFLSVRREFIGESQRVKEVFMASATDLRRERYLQGAGLLDLLRALQSV